MSSRPKRPTGITLLAGVFLWIGCLGSVFFPVFLISGLSMSMLNQSLAGIGQSVPWLRLVVHFGVYLLLIIWFLLYIAYACIGFGLWKLRNWARQALLGLSIFSVAISVGIMPFVVKPAALAFATTVGLALPFAWLIWYLKRPQVRFAFGGPPMQVGPLNSGPPPGMSTRGKILTATAVLASFALFCSTLMFAVEGMFHRSQIYKITLNEAERSPCVAAKVGNPLTPGWIVTGNMEESDANGSAHFEVPVKGPKGTGNVVVSANKQGGAWTIDKFVLVQGKEEIDLMASTSSSACR
jgi:hypothetical protein